MRSIFLKELTSPEVGEYLKQGGRTAYIPVGCTEMHGLVGPLGTDTLIAEAFSVLMARASQGLVLPSVEYTWAGSTDGFPGSISVDYQLVDRLVQGIVVRAWRGGFRRIVLISVHHGNHYALFHAVRRLLETDGIPAMYVNPYAPFNEKSAALQPHGCVEMAQLLASLKILGKESLYDEAAMNVVEEIPAQCRKSLRPGCGVTGYYMQDERQHVCAAAGTSAAEGLRFLEAQRDVLLPQINKLDAYLDETRAWKNQGTFRT